MNERINKQTKNKWKQKWENERKFIKVTEWLNEKIPRCNTRMNENKQNE